MIPQVCNAAAQAAHTCGGFWISDDRAIAIFGACVLFFFIGLNVGQRTKS